MPVHPYTCFCFCIQLHLFYICYHWNNNYLIAEMVLLIFITIINTLYSTYWEVISGYHKYILYMHEVFACVLSHVGLFETLWIVTCQAPSSMGFFRQAYWCGLPFTPPRDLPDPLKEPTSPVSSEFQGRFFICWAIRKPNK